MYMGIHSVELLVPKEVTSAEDMPAGRAWGYELAYPGSQVVAEVDATGDLPVVIMSGLDEQNVRTDQTYKYRGIGSAIYEVFKGHRAVIAGDVVTFVSPGHLSAAQPDPHDPTACIMISDLYSLDDAEFAGKTLTARRKMLAAIIGSDSLKPDKVELAPRFAADRRIIRELVTMGRGIRGVIARRNASLAPPQTDADEALFLKLNQDTWE